MILFATQNFLPSIGGTQLYVTGLADALAAKGHGIEVFCDSASGAAAARVDSARQYPIRRFAGPRPFMRRRKARAVVERISRGGATALITDTWKSLEHLPANALANVRVLCLAHGSEFLQPPGSSKERLMIACLAKADVIAANSHFTAELVKPFVRDPPKVRVLLPGVDPPAGASRALAARDDTAPPRLLTIARLEARKGIDAVLRALPSLPAKYPALRYDVIGKGADRARLVALAEKLGISEHVRFRGYISEDNKADLLSRATLCLMPNRREPGSVEGFGMVFVEAAAFGVPSIAGADGGTSDAVLHEQTGLIADGESDEAVRAAICRLLPDPTERRAMGEAAHRRFWDEFAWDTAIHRFEAALID
ncbi:MAG TPA: glycosyltransferase family 4 protein [Rhizomicrobium sp.]|jgi:phosphatidylinositol alpha-1,6-mannosyltransferase